MGKLSIFFCLLLGVNTLEAAVNRPDGAYFLNSKSYSIDLSEYIFTQMGSYDLNGNYSALQSTNSFNLFDTNLKIGYGLSKNIEGQINARFRILASQTISDTPKAMGPESLGVNLKYQFIPAGNNYFAVGVRYLQTLYSTTKYTLPNIAPTNKIVLGDDGSEYGIDFYASLLKPQSRFDLYLSYNSPPNYLSQEILYKGEVLLQFGRLGILTGIDGIYSLKKDPYSNDQINKPKISTGTTSLFNSINREKLEAYLGAIIDFKSISMSARGGTVLKGVSTDKGYFGLLNITYTSKGLSSEEATIDSFKEYHLEGSVLKVSARGNYIKIDQGISTDVEKGMQFDIYQTDYFGGNILVATGYVQEIGSDWSVIKLVKKYAEIEIKPGFQARGK